MFFDRFSNDSPSRDGSLDGKSTTLFCFSPAVTMGTFIVEILLALYVLLQHRKTQFGRRAAVFLFLLATFQFAESMICGANGNVTMWTMIGWSAITYLPAIGVDLASMITRRRTWLVHLGYTFATLLTFQFVMMPTPPSAVQCTGTAVEFFGNINLFSILYASYYGVFLLIAVAYLAYHWYVSSAKRGAAAAWLLLGYASFMLPTAIYYVFVPASQAAFPSVFCGFAIFLALISVGKVLPLYEAGLLEEMRPEKVSAKSKRRS